MLGRVAKLCRAAIMIISGSFWAKAFVTVVAACTFAALFEVTTLDSRYAARPATRHEANALPLPGERVAFSATAYCKGIVTTAGVAVQAGVAAADPEMLPVGSVVEIDSLPQKYNGVYTILDTGPAVQGRHVDLYMWSCNEALAFGRRPIHLSVLRMGWNPRATTVGFIDKFLKRPLPSRPLPQAAPAAAAELTTKN
jgi:3D (Asp-Asp-Asp) domain-containing protein